MKHPDIISDERKSHSSDVYIDFLSKNLGASREEVLDVIKRSGISARRIAEYLISKQLTEPEQIGN